MTTCFTLDDMDKKCTNYIYLKKKKSLSFWFQEDDEKKNTIHSKSPRSHFFFQISTAKMYLYRSLLIAKNCMIDGRMHELCLSNCGSTIIQLHHLKEKKNKRKKTLAFICTKASCKALFRTCRVLCWIS